MAKHTAESIREAAKYGQGTGAFQRLVLEILADLLEEKERVDALRRIASKKMTITKNAEEPEMIQQHERNIPTTKT